MNYKKTYRRAIHEIRDSVSPQERSRAPRRVALSAVVVIGVGAAFFFAAIPQKADAVIVDRIVNALGSAQTYHLTVGYRIGDHPLMERWRDGSRKRYIFWNESRPEIDRAFDGKRVWSIQYDDKMATIKTEAPTYFGEEDAPTVEKIVGEFRHFTKGAHTVKRSLVAGNQVITLTKTGAKDRVEIAVDERDRPVEISYQKRVDDGDWKTNSITKIEYPISLSDDVFQFSPPADFRVCDSDKTQETLKQGFKSGEQETVAGVTVRLIGAVQQQNGDVYVMWTGGGAPPYLAKGAASTADGKWLYADMVAAAFNPERPLPKMDKNRVYPAEGNYIGIYPLMTHQSTPVYALHVIAGKYSGALKVTIPICKLVKPYLQQIEKSTKHRTTGVLVGTATFQVTPLQIDNMTTLVKDLDPSSRGLFVNYSIEYVGLYDKEQERLESEARKAHEEWMNSRIRRK